ncbi:MAG: hypothetical protein ACK40M_10865, partial [Flavobacteriales bacterium]
NRILRLIYPTSSSLAMGLWLVIPVLHWIIGNVDQSFQGTTWNEDIATWENVNISARMDLWMLLTITFLLLIGVITIVCNHFIFHYRKTRWFPAIVCGGWILALQLLDLLGHPQNTILPYIQSAWLTALLIGLKPHRSINLWVEWIFILALSFNTAYLFNAIDDSQHINKIDTEGAFFILSSVFFLILRIPSLHSYSIHHLLRIFFPLIISSVVWTFSRELWHIANAREWYIKSPIILFPWLLIAFTLPVFIWKKLRLCTEKNPFSTISFLLLVSIVIPAFYQDTYTFHGDPFELANPANAMMRHYEMGEYVFGDFFSSHLLSEQVSGWVYYFLHGYNHDLGFMTYNMFGDMLYCILIYLLLIEVTGNRIHSLLITLLFPLIATLFPPSYSFMIVSALIGLLIYRNFGLKTLLIAIGWSLFLIVWRLDLGIANAFAFSITISFIWIRRGFFLHRKSVLWSLFILTFTLLIIYLILPTKTKLNLAEAWKYISAQQAHGLPAIALNRDHYLVFHYFVLPGIILIILFRTAARFLQKKENKLDVFLLYLGTAYFFNIQRGLVRHSLLEGNDAFITSFGLFVLFISVKREWALKTPVIIGSLTLISLAFSWPQRNGEKSTLHRWDESISLAKYPNGMHPVSREDLSAAPNINQFFELKQFFDHYFPKSATFIDLSNQPMLYYFMQRPVPSYFNQGLQNVMTVEMQENYVDRLKKHDIPMVIYSGNPRTWFDDIDRIPNQLRYGVVREYVFENYHPHSIIGEKYIWLRNDIRDKVPSNTIDTLASPIDIWDLRSSIYGRYGKNNFRWNSSIERKFISTDTIEGLPFGNWFSDYYLGATAKNFTNEKQRVEIHAIQNKQVAGIISFELHPGKSMFTIPFHAQARVRKFGADQFIIYKNPDVEINTNFIIGEKICNHCP